MKRNVQILLICCMLLLALGLSGCGAPALGENANDASAAEISDSGKTRLPAAEDYEAGPRWNGADAPTEENGPWRAAYALLHDLEERAEAFQNVSPQVKLSVACHDPAQSGPGQLIGAWAAAVTVASEGRIQINVGYSGTLSGAMSAMDDMRQGTIDMVWTLPCYFKGYMPLVNVIQNPGLQISDGASGSYAMWKLYQSEPAIQEECRANGEPLFLCVNCTSPLSYKGDGKIEGLGDISGNIRANSGPAQLVVDALGGNVFGCPIGDVYNNIKSGILSFLITDWNGIDSFELSDPDVLNYYLDTNIGCSAFALIANSSVWENLNEQSREDILSASGDYMLNFVEIWNYWEATGRYNAIKHGGTVYDPSDDLASQLDALYEEVAENWIADQSDPALARTLYEHAQSLVQAYRPAAEES